MAYHEVQQWINSVSRRKLTSTVQKQLAGRSPAVRQHGTSKLKNQADLNMTRLKNPGG